MTITPTQLADWKGLAEAVSPPPGMIIRNHKDWEFYEAAQTAVPALVQECERLQKELLTCQASFRTLERSWSGQFSEQDNELLGCRDSLHKAITERNATSAAASILRHEREALREAAKQAREALHDCHYILPSMISDKHHDAYVKGTKALATLDAALDTKLPSGKAD